MSLAEELRFDMGAGWDADSVSCAGRVSGAGSGGSDGSVGLLDVSELVPVFELVVASIGVLEPTPAMVMVGRFQRLLSAFEANIVASHIESGASPRATEDLVSQGGKRSKKERKKRARRAGTVRNNPSLKDDLADGSVSEEQLDDLADADTKTGGAASKNPELLDKVRATNPDQSKELVKKFVDQHNQPDNETRHQKQRRLRKVSRFTTKDGMDAVLAEGDTATINAIWKMVSDRADQLYRKDGGRNLPRSKHDRTSAQRMFDAFTEHFTTTHSPNSGDDDGSKAARRTDTRRPAIVVGCSLDDDGQLSGPLVYGSGPSPQNVFDRYLCNAEIVGILFSGNGQPLWHSRKIRTASPAQHRALVARDQGCVLCRAPHQHCETHHLIPWSSPASGPTNIDNLALVCPDCHHQLHDTHKTLYLNDQQIWTTRPATPNEIAPKNQSGKTEPQSRPPSSGDSPSGRRKKYHHKSESRLE